MMHWGAYGWGMGGGWLFMVFFWALMIAAAVAVVVAITRRTGGVEARGGSAVEILKKRYAKGEITKDEYESMKKDIEGR
jgi:putative membrane protein